MFLKYNYVLYFSNKLHQIKGKTFSSVICKGETEMNACKNWSTHQFAPTMSLLRTLNL